MIDLSSSVQENVFQQAASSLMMTGNPLEKPASLATTTTSSIASSSCPGPLNPGDKMSDFGEKTENADPSKRSKSSNKKSDSASLLSNLFFADEVDSEMNAISKYATRQDLVLAECIDFVNTFFDLNPLSQLGNLISSFFFKNFLT